MTGKYTIVQNTNPDCMFSKKTYSMILYVNFYFNEKFVLMTKNGNVNQINCVTYFRDVAGNTKVIRQANT